MNKAEIGRKIKTQITQNPIDFIILSALRGKEPMRVAQLARETNYCSTYMTRRLDPLQKEGLVRIEADAANLNAKLVSLAFPESYLDEFEEQGNEIMANIHPDIHMMTRR